MKNRIIGAYSVFLGLSLVGLWIMILLNGDIPEGRTEMSFHLTSEFLMALLAFISGILLWRDRPRARLLSVLAHGMVIYSVLNAAGYYGERSNTGMMLMFILLLLISLLICLFHLLHETRDMSA